MLRLVPRESQRSGAQARYTRKPPHEVRARASTWEHGLAPKKGGFSLVHFPSMVHDAIAASAARRARAQQARVLRLLPRESQRSGAQAHYTRKPPHEVRARSGTWEHGLAPKKGGFLLVRCPFMAHEAIAASVARRARATSARAAPFPQREPAKWRASALHAQATSRSEGQGWHVGAHARFKHARAPPHLLESAHVRRKHTAPARLPAASVHDLAPTCHPRPRTSSRRSRVRTREYATGRALSREEAQQARLRRARSAALVGVG